MVAGNQSLEGVVISSTGEKDTKSLPQSRYTVADPPKELSIQEFQSLTIEWRDEKENDELNEKSKSWEDEKSGNTNKLGAPGKEKSRTDGLIYDPTTWQIFQIEYHDELPTNIIQIAWPSDHTNIMPVPNKFPAFPTLPTELRHSIWRYALRSHSRPVKLHVGPKFQGGNLINLSCHLRNYGPRSTKLPTSFLYVCHESQSIFLERYEKMHLSSLSPSLDPTIVSLSYPRDGRLVNGEIRTDSKGYIDFRHDMLMVDFFRNMLTKVLPWNQVSLDLSLVESLALPYHGILMDQSPINEGAMTVWQALETGCPSLKRLTFISGSMDNTHFDAAPEAFARLLPINAELIDAVESWETCHNVFQDEFAKFPHKTDLALLRAFMCDQRKTRMYFRQKSEIARSAYGDANAIRILYYQQIESNPEYWRKIDFDVAFISMVFSTFYTGKRMDKFIVVPPKNLRTLLPNSYFWAQRPTKNEEKEPEFLSNLCSYPVYCNPDGSLLNRYEGVKEMFE